jgi:hypothetical protein
MKNTTSKFIFASLLALLMAFPAFAQKDKIDYKDDMIWVNGKAFAKMERKSRGLACTTTPSAVCRGLSSFSSGPFAGRMSGTTK